MIVSDSGKPGTISIAENDRRPCVHGVRPSHCSLCGEADDIGYNLTIETGRSAALAALYNSARWQSALTNRS